jgi:aspartate-semialdehyde dehydrogenase
MVGSVLVQRMREERDFDLIDPVFFSTSQGGHRGPGDCKRTGKVQDATTFAPLTAMDVLISCQGGDLHESRSIRSCAPAGWTGYWIDAPPTLRMADDAVIILDPSIATSSIVRSRAAFAITSAATAPSA